MDRATQRNGRPPKDPEFRIGSGRMLQVRIQRARYGEVRNAAQAEGLPITAWARHVIYQELKRRARSNHESKSKH
jgi:hypothetical protein